MPKLTDDNVAATIRRMEMAHETFTLLRILRDEINRKTTESVFNDNWNDSYHVEVTLSIAECRRVLKLLSSMEKTS